MKDSKLSKSSVILGATGGFGAAMALEMTAQGEALKLVVRSPEKLPPSLKDQSNVEILQDIDVMNINDLVKVFTGAGNVVFALNVDYTQWDPFMVHALSATLEALSRLEDKPKLIFPGNVYALGPAKDNPFTEKCANCPSTKKGRLRDRLETMLKQAHDEHDISVLIVRGCDFFGPTVRNGFVDRIFGNIAAGRQAEIFGKGVIPHQFTYVPDMARATFDLMKHSGLKAYDIINAPITTEVTVADIISKLNADKRVAIKALPWSIVKIIGLFSPMFKEIYEMKYLYETRVRLSTDKIKKLLPDFHPTALDKALKETLQSY